MERENYIVEEIVKRRQAKHGPQYLVKWVGYPIEQSTWQPREHLFYLQDELDEEVQKLDQMAKKKKAKSKSVKIKKSNNKKIKQYLRNKNEKSKDKTVKQKETATLDEVKKQETTTTRRQSSVSTQKPKKIKIIERYKDESNKNIILIKIQDRICELPALQVTILYPVELSIFYESEIKKYLAAK